MSHLPTFKELREQHKITIEQLSKVSLINERRVRAFEETNATFPGVFDALLSALSKIANKRYMQDDVYFIPALRSWSSEPFEGPLQERPTLREIVYHYQLDAYLIHKATDVPFRMVEEMLIGRPVKRELVEKVLQVVSMYLNESYTPENIVIEIEE